MPGNNNDDLDALINEVETIISTPAGNSSSNPANNIKSTTNNASASLPQNPQPSIVKKHSIASTLFGGNGAGTCAGGSKLKQDQNSEPTTSQNMLLNLATNKPIVQENEVARSQM